MGATSLFSNFTSAQPPSNCDCLWHGSFARAYSHADFIFSGQVVATKGNSADIRIEQQFFYNANYQPDFNNVVRIWGDNGKLCRPDITEFPVGSKWVLAVNKITDIPAGGFNPNTPNISYGREGDYYLSQCGAYWLAVHDDFVTGNLVKGRRWSWENTDMNPVLIDLIKAYIKGIIPEQALIEAAKPLTATKKLMEDTKNFIRQQ